MLSSGKEKFLIDLDNDDELEKQAASLIDQPQAEPFEKANFSSELLKYEIAGSQYLSRPVANLLQLSFGEDKIKKKFESIKMMIGFPPKRVRLIVSKTEYFEFSDYNTEVRLICRDESDYKRNLTDPQYHFFRAIDYIMSRVDQQVREAPFDWSSSLKSPKMESALAQGLKTTLKSELNGQGRRFNLKEEISRNLSEQALSPVKKAPTPTVKVKTCGNSLFVSEPSKQTISTLDLKFDEVATISTGSEAVDFAVFIREEMTVVAYIDRQSLQVHFSDKLYSPLTKNVIASYTHDELTFNDVCLQVVTAVEDKYLIVGARRHNRKSDDLYVDLHLFVLSTTLRFRQRISSHAMDDCSDLNLAGICLRKSTEGDRQIILLLDDLNRHLVAFEYDSYNHRLMPACHVQTVASQGKVQGSKIPQSLFTDDFLIFSSGGSLYVTKPNC